MHEKVYISLCPEICAPGFSIFVVEKLGEKISPNVLEYDRNIRNLPPFYIVIEMRVI